MKELGDMVCLIWTTGSPPATNQRVRGWRRARVQGFDRSVPSLLLRGGFRPGRHGRSDNRSVTWDAAASRPSCAPRSAMLWPPGRNTYPATRGPRVDIELSRTWGVEPKQLIVETAINLIVVNYRRWRFTASKEKYAVGSPCPSQLKCRRQTAAARKSPLEALGVCLSCILEFCDRCCR
jgi:hypothetical protein